TPGLGTQVKEQFFTDRFLKKNLNDLAGIEAITGATISSRAVIRAVEEKAVTIGRLIQDGE
ncbi:MAG: FMN-binding protein, partial [Candidatus Omnitrophica bacterium]|nr:FMN-binding protein [Candidatus Omnitrophota bacterium]